jgi:phosphomevalonate decarboxylase
VPSGEVNDTKASAVAHPIQGLVKYHGLRDPLLRLPFHDSISVCTAPLETWTTVEFMDEARADVLELNGRVLEGRPLERASTVLDAVRRLAGIGTRARVVSRNDFPTNVGLGASASAFAAGALAAAGAVGLDLDQRQLSTIARLGAGSASRSVAGGFALWHTGTDHGSSFAERLDGGDLEMGIVAVVVKALKLTEDFHKEVVGSPFFKARLEYVGGALDEMRRAIDARDVEAIGQLAEADTLVLHGITMTGPSHRVLWRPETMVAMQEVWAMREDGIPAHFSIDTGATVYVNCPIKDVVEVEERLRERELETLACHVGDGARLVDRHLV